MTEASSECEHGTSIRNAARQRIVARGRGTPGKTSDATRPVLGSDDPVPRVPSARCAACEAPITRVHPCGPLPRYCPRCRAWLRDWQRLRGYLRSGVNLAEALGLETVAARAADAVAALDGLGYGRHP